MFKVRYPIFFIAIFWLFGLLLASYLFVQANFLVTLLILGLCLLVVSFIFYYQKLRYWFLILLMGIFIIAFVRMGFYQIEHKSNFNDNFFQETEMLGIRGYIDSKPIIDGDVVKFTIKPSSYLINNKEIKPQTQEDILIYLYLDEEKEKVLVENWEKGMGVRLDGEIKRPNSARNPGQFDYQRYLEKRGIYWVVNVYGTSNVEVTNSSGILSGLNRLNKLIEESIDSQYSEPNSGFIKAIVLGNRQDLDQSISEDFSILGLSHLLAISGLHLSIFSLMLFWTLTRLRVTREKATYIISVILILYMFLTGASPSVVRATIMTLIVLYSISFKNPINGLQSLGLAFLIMTLLNPYYIYDIGFQLSFTITFFIIWGFPLIHEKLPIRNELLRKSISLVVITQTASLPLALYYFNQYSILSILTNLLIVPLFSIIILPASIISITLDLVNLYISRVIASILSQLLDYLFKILDMASQLTFFHYYGHFPSIFVLIFFYIVLVWLIMRSRTKNSFISNKIKKSFFLIEKILIVIFIIAIIFYSNDNKGMITFIDVGQGDSILIETPDNYHVLLDSGGNFVYPKEEWQQRKNPFDVGEDILLPYLHYRGIDTLDLAILTHEDLDHLGGYLSLIDEIKIKSFIVPRDFPRTELGEELSEKLKKNGINVIRIDSPKGIEIDQHTQLMLIPVNIPNSNKENDNILVSFLQIYNTNIAFSSDLEKAGEIEVLQNYNLDSVNILKVGHHGSNTSTTEEWLNRLSPDDAIISVGKNNRFGHPTPEVIERLKDSNANIWRTDEDGAIVIYVMPTGYKIIKTQN